MSFDFRRGTAVSTESVGLNKFEGDIVSNTKDLDAEHAAEGRRTVRPETEADRFECETEMESLRSRVDVLHAARDAIGSGEVDPAMEAFMVDTGLCDPFSAENFATESLDLMGKTSGLPAALDREIGETEARIRQLRDLTL